MALCTVELQFNKNVMDADGNMLLELCTSNTYKFTWEDFQTREDFVNELAEQYRREGASFQFTGTRVAKSEPYQDPRTGNWDETYIHFVSGANEALQIDVIRAVDAR